MYNKVQFIYFYALSLAAFDIDIITQQMFQNSYQNGTYFDIFDPKVSQDKTKNLFKIQNITGNNKIFDKQLKTYVLEFNNPNAKMLFPKQDRKQLYLIQQFLNLQIYFYQGMPWNIQLSISDLTKTKRRVVLSPINKSQNKPFFVKFPCSHVQEGIWTNLTIDLYSFISAFKGQTYRSLDVITISGHFKVRRIFTTQEPPLACSNSQQSKAINLLPKAIFLPPEIECANCMISYQQTSLVAEQIYQTTEPSSKSRSNILSRNQISTPKTQTTKTQKKGYKNQKKFLADTNGPQKNKYKRQSISGQADKSQYTQKPGGSIQKQKKPIKRQGVGKSQALKGRSSIQKKSTIRNQQKNNAKSKLNPWRSDKKNETHTDGGSQLSETKILNPRKIESAQTTLFKTKNNLASRFNDSTNKGFDHRSDHYSDSDYVELSQKFSTLTEGKFFKNELGSQHLEKQKQHDEIQQNIEMQSNSMCQSSKRKQQNELIKQLKNQPIDESISDSLDNLVGKAQKINMNKNKNGNNAGSAVKASMMNSYYGFGQKLMNKYMNEVERPYSPPIGDREVTEQMSQKHEQLQEKQVQLIYDPVLNCYYDHKTHTYYELKN